MEWDNPAKAAHQAAKERYMVSIGRHGMYATEKRTSELLIQIWWFLGKILNKGKGAQKKYRERNGEKISVTERRCYLKRKLKKNALGELIEPEVLAAATVLMEMREGI